MSCGCNASKNSDYIRWVQGSLNGLMGLRLPLTGVMDAPARRALRNFQAQRGLPVDGLAGPGTKRALAEARVRKSVADRGRPQPETFEAWGGEFQELEFTDQESNSGLSRPVPKSIWRNNTDLDAPYFGGNFNFLYNGGSSEAQITFNTYLSYRKNYSEPLKRAFINHLDAAAKVWDGAAELQVRDISGNFNQRIKLRFKLNIVRDSKNANKKTDIHPDNTRSAWFMGKGRETVMRELNAFIGSSRNVLVHELGHVWGLLDEYDIRWIEKKFSLGHVGTGSPLLADKLAIMNDGYADELRDTGEFRGRYFKHFGRAILGAFWGLKNHVIPIKHNGKVVANSIQGRIALLKKNIANSPPYANDSSPLNPRFTLIQVAKT
jgi:peptidoglycan hydrolase-like protein with peptidoglycan-binding domain